MKIGELFEYVREEFEKEISKKTEWGKNELMNAYDRVTTRALVKFYDKQGQMAYENQLDEKMKLFIDNPVTKPGFG